MRKIAFRAWNKKEKKIFYFDLSDLAYGDDGRFSSPRHEDVRLEWSDLEDDLMQFTGLSDKNGVECYEGDVVLIADSYTDRVTDEGQGPTYDEPQIVEVVFQEQAFGAVMGSSDIFQDKFYSFQQIKDEAGLEDLEIIGNSYENRDLLTKDKPE